ncbi:NADH-quinone oxidoreductase subunit L [Sulfurirhabdus autotrophica]|uniref:Probable inorganic carbon transporter subunit DabB n=1 Tax=Sulfurirhabdus autotrophica TaxID=1706046 RepID=A0A4R3Y160_9PROT|nr:NADH-quinone oxidoreductase subunit L [Sulfurirhabdus autotrophica]TCV85162.1 NAD(P)H-quinone oxidoreductase subunit 5 [Sulfurirhabdus autotrophica]
MQSISSLLTPILVIFAPLILLLAGLIPTGWANQRPRFMARLNGTISWIACFSALLAAAVHSFDGTRTWTLYTIDLPGDIGAFSISAYVNSVTVIMLVLVSFVGAVVTRYSRNNLDGDRNQGRFHKWLSLTLGTILTLIISGNMLMFWLAWISNSLCLHQLLTFYRERPAALLAAHKKFIANRISDLSHLTAIFLIGSTLHSLEYADVLHSMAAMNGPLPLALEWASVLIVLSAVLKSAQFPLHGWLIQVVEAPTPVSALLHAGIVNAGAFLIIRMSPIMSQSEVAQGSLAVIGLTTLALASLVMLTQTSIKVSLAWSTTAQMGFMLLECGLGLYSLAMLHLVAHSLYKAHAFLASGSGVDAFRAPAITSSPGGFKPGLIVMALITGGLMALGVGAAFGITPDAQPALIATATIVAIAMSQLLLQSASAMGNGVLLLRGLGLSAVVCVAYFTLHTLFEMALKGSVLPIQDAAGPFQSALALVIVGVFLALMMLQQALKYAPTALREGLYMHLYNGLYIDVYITRLLQRVWPSPKPVQDSLHTPFATEKSHGD